MESGLEIDLRFREVGGVKMRFLMENWSGRASTISGRWWVDSGSGDDAAAASTVGNDGGGVESGIGTRLDAGMLWYSKFTAQATYLEDLHIQGLFVEIYG